MSVAREAKARRARRHAIPSRPTAWLSHTNGSSEAEG
jgi:hypothetical protein